MKTFSDLENALKYTFRDKALLLNALTHTSYANEHFQENRHLNSNERVEFIGDAVLGLIAGTYIFENFPLISEGRMSKLRASVVCETTLAKLALAVHIDQFLRLGVGEDQTGGRSKASILADAFESVLGAVYLDGGFEAARSMLLPLIVPEIMARADNLVLSDYKSRLQELLGKTRLAATYEMVSAVGPDHDKTFTSRVSIGDDKFAFGEGKTKKEAEQAAAKRLMELLEENA